MASSISNSSQERLILAGLEDANNSFCIKDFLKYIAIPYNLTSKESPTCLSLVWKPYQQELRKFITKQDLKSSNINLSASYASFLVEFVNKVGKTQCTKDVPLQCATMALDILLKIQSQLDCGDFAIEKMHYLVAKQYIQIKQSSNALWHLSCINQSMWQEYRTSTGRKTFEILTSSMSKIQAVDVVAFPKVWSEITERGIKLTVACLWTITHILASEKSYTEVMKVVDTHVLLWLRHWQTIDPKGATAYFDKVFRVLWKCASDLEKDGNSVKEGLECRTLALSCMKYCVSTTYFIQQVLRSGVNSIKIEASQSSQSTDDVEKWVLQFYYDAAENLGIFNSKSTDYPANDLLYWIEHFVSLCRRQKLYEFAHEHLFSIVAKVLRQKNALSDYFEWSFIFGALHLDLLAAWKVCDKSIMDFQLGLKKKTRVLDKSSCQAYAMKAFLIELSASAHVKVSNVSPVLSKVTKYLKQMPILIIKWSSEPPVEDLMHDYFSGMIERLLSSKDIKVYAGGLQAVRLMLNAHCKIIVDEKAGSVGRLVENLQAVETSLLSGVSHTGDEEISQVLTLLCHNVISAGTSLTRQGEKKSLAIEVFSACLVYLRIVSKHMVDSIEGAALTFVSTKLYQNYKALASCYAELKEYTLAGQVYLESFCNLPTSSLPYHAQVDNCVGYLIQGYIENKPIIKKSRELKKMGLQDLDIEIQRYFAQCLTRWCPQLLQSVRGGSGTSGLVISELCVPLAYEILENLRNPEDIVQLKLLKRTTSFAKYYMNDSQSTTSLATDLYEIYCEILESKKESSLVQLIWIGILGVEILVCEWQEEEIVHRISETAVHSHVEHAVQEALTASDYSNALVESLKSLLVASRFMNYQDIELNILNILRKIGCSSKCDVLFSKVETGDLVSAAKEFEEIECNAEPSYLILKSCLMIEVEPDNFSGIEKLRDYLDSIETSTPVDNILRSCQKPFVDRVLSMEQRSSYFLSLARYQLSFGIIADAHKSVSESLRISQKLLPCGFCREVLYFGIFRQKIKGLHILCRILIADNKCKKALAYGNEACAMLESLPNSNYLKRENQSIMIEILLGIKRVSNALEYMLPKDRNSYSHLQRAQEWIHQGDISLLQEDFEVANEAFEHARTLLEHEIKRKERQSLHLRDFICQCLQRLVISAIRCGSSSFQDLKNLLEIAFDSVASKAARCEILWAKAQLHVHFNDFENAQIFALDLLGLLYEMNRVDLVSPACRLLSTTYFKNGDFTAASMLQCRSINVDNNEESTVSERLQLSKTERPLYSKWFNRWLDEFQSIQGCVDESQVVVSMCLNWNGDLLCGRLQSDCQPLLFTVPKAKLGFKLKQFDKIIEENRKTLSNVGSNEELSSKQKKSWWAQRKALDTAVRSWASTIDQVIGFRRCIFYDGPFNPEWEEQISSWALELHSSGGSYSENVLRLLVHSRETLSDKELYEGLASLIIDDSTTTDEGDATKIKMIVDQIRSIVKVDGATNKNSSEILATKKMTVAVLKKELKARDLSVSGLKAVLQARLQEHLERTGAPAPSRSKSVMLLLGESLHSYPWEGMPPLRNSDCVCRIPNLAYVRDLSEYKINPADGRYVINPAQDLPHTQETLEPLLSKFGWQGQAGTQPTEDQLIGHLSTSDVVVYCGHGSGEKYLNHRPIPTPCSAVMLLGCSSGRLSIDGRSGLTSGQVWKYLSATCPGVVASLWDVTDKDLDRWSVYVLSNAFDNSTKTSVLLNKILPSGGSVCKLPALTGMAMVAYGAPLHVIK